LLLGIAFQFSYLAFDCGGLLLSRGRYPGIQGYNLFHLHTSLVSLFVPNSLAIAGGMLVAVVLLLLDALGLLDEFLSLALIV
jgi:hypothetical protein